MNRYEEATALDRALLNPADDYRTRSVAIPAGVGRRRGTRGIRCAPAIDPVGLGPRRRSEGLRMLGRNEEALESAERARFFEPATSTR
jgi:hypothetical protein